MYIIISLEVAERLNSNGPEVSEFKDIVGIIRTESTPVCTTPGLLSLDITTATYLVDVLNIKLLYGLGPKLYGPKGTHAPLVLNTVRLPNRVA